MDNVDFDDWISRVDSCNECDVKVVNELFSFKQTEYKKRSCNF
ncbi:hypothetical protein D920_01366 [Enterococcus faecalis 13-SD-W-01]|nr:hypothetical protein D920_01366 [Enterococcus faecalis 13-SD-W-01]